MSTMLKLALAPLIAILLAGCKTTPTPEINARVANLAPVSVSRFDSCETQRHAARQATEIARLQKRTETYSVSCANAWDLNPAAVCALTGKGCPATHPQTAVPVS